MEVFSTLGPSSLGYDSTAVSPHPLGVKPTGNAYATNENAKLAAGSFAILPDELLVQILEYLDAKALLQIQCTCKALYAFSRLEDPWKTLCIESCLSQINWRGTWRSTYLNIPETQLTNFTCPNLFSDVLYRPFLCAHTPLQAYACDIPARNCISRLSDISFVDFDRDWADKPFILTTPIRAWPVFRDWSIATLLKQYDNVKFRAEAVNWPLNSYVDYMKNNADESPLYLFDRSFVEKMGVKVGEGGHYWSPECFREDLFSVLGQQRPDSRWLIVGPERSGSTFHKDPNATCAWNAILEGSKYWIMFPSSPSQPSPPGVFVSEDQGEVTSPLSIAEWLIEFHAEARRTPGCMEGICGEGEVLYVPSGWWHLVVNLETSIAITQNFVPEAHLANVLDFLKHKPDQISGFRTDVKNPFKLFVHKMEESHPEILARALAKLEMARPGKKRKWEELVNVNDNDSAIRVEDFSFGFSNGDDDVP